MADALPEISLGYVDDGAAAVFVDITPVRSAPELIVAAPWICAPDQALLCAKAVNHLAQEQAYTVIEDPARFADWYRKRRAAEAPGKPSPEGNFGLRNFGMPDLDGIAVPAIAGGTLTFYAVSRQIGAPYKVTAALTELDKPDYDPLPMTAAD
jgi:hypothetical protein